MRVVSIHADLMDDEAQKMIDALVATGDPGLGQLASEMDHIRRLKPDVIVEMDREWETPRVTELRNTCEVEGCGKPRDKDEWAVDMCSEHATQWHNGELDNE